MPCGCVELPAQPEKLIAKLRPHRATPQVSAAIVDVARLFGDPLGFPAPPGGIRSIYLYVTKYLTDN